MLSISLGLYGIMTPFLFRLNIGLKMSKLPFNKIVGCSFTLENFIKLG